MTIATRAFFDARVVRPGMTGVGRATLELLRALAALARKGELELRALVLRRHLSDLAADPALEGVEPVPTDHDPESHPGGDWALETSLARLARAEEVWHGPAFVVPGGSRSFARVVTIHDLCAFERPRDQSFAFGTYLRWRVRRSLRSCDAAIAPTLAVAEAVRRRFPRLAGEPPDPFVRAIHEAPVERGIAAWESPADPAGPAGAGGFGALEPLLPIGAPAGPLFVSIGPVERRKDPATAARAFALVARESPAARWVWIGRPGHRADEIRAEVARALGPGVAERFHFVGARPSDQVERAMRDATAFVYPSLDEGFGLPPLEAMRAGTPVVVSDIPPLRETCGGAAGTFPPGDPAALAERLRELLRDTEEARLARIERGRLRAARFDWARAARETLETYRMASEIRRRG